MNHNQARLLIGAGPHSVPPELAEHLASCPECTQFQRETIALDGNIRLALEQGPLGPDSVAVASVTPITSARTKRRPKSVKAWSGWALAASIAVASVLVVWALLPSDTLAHAVVAHVEYEPDSWTSKQPVPAATVKETLAKAGVALDMSSNDVMYARSCFFRGHFVPHLVVHTAHGPVTVLILRHEKVKERTSFHEDGMTGVITPTPPGSIAVLARDNDDVDAAARHVQKSLRWLDSP
jgi:Protein of unknown function (DUF3379)